MEEKDNLTKKVVPPSDEEKRALKTYRIIEWGLVALIVIGFFINFKAGLVAIVFLLWSEYWYGHGAEKFVVDEYEQGGYPTEGLSTMFKSWVYFAVIMAIVLYFYL